MWLLRGVVKFHNTATIASLRPSFAMCSIKHIILSKYSAFVFKVKLTPRRRAGRVADHKLASNDPGRLIFSGKVKERIDGFAKIVSNK